MIHQATANRWPLSAHMVPGVAALFLFLGRTDGHTQRVKIMTTYSAVAWWVNVYCSEYWSTRATHSDNYFHIFGPFRNNKAVLLHKLIKRLVEWIINNIFLVSFTLCKDYWKEFTELSRENSCLKLFFVSRLLSWQRSCKSLVLFWPTKPRPNRWSLFSCRLSVRPSVTKTKRYNVNVGALKTKYSLRQLLCKKIMTTYWLGPGGSLWSLPTLNVLF